ncbi:hypothetical protein K7432_015575 [Basidiobolus ranarum]|uniref:Carrier domain-containing protein n=1 Tax=Basidiobolus ranarum TaxID=34480 RepID=A0ABR2VN37_9FUNG
MALSRKDNASYLAQRVYKFEPNIDVQRLQSAWEVVIRANPILRTTIVFSSSNFFHLSGLQVVLNEEHILWNVCDLEQIASLDSDISHILAQDRAKGIPANDPQTRFTLLRVNGSATHLIWTIHHALYDGWSMGQIENDVREAYLDISTPSRPSYNTYIEYILSLDKHRSLDYWKIALSNTPMTHLAKSTSDSGELQCSSQITRELHADFNSLTNVHAITMATVAYLAWAMVLKVHTGNSDVVFGAVNSGRNIPLKDIQDICGPCINTLPIRISMLDDSSLLSIMKLIQATQIEQSQHQTVGLQDILKHCCDEGVNSLFDSLIVIQNLDQLGKMQGLAGIGLKEITATMPSNYPIVMELSSQGSNHQISLTYNKQAVTEFEACWIVSHFTAAMEVILSDPHTLMKGSNIITFEEAALVESWSGTSFNDNEIISIHSMFEKNVLIHPDNIAVQFETSEYVTYTELNQRANQLAHHLVELGVRPESMVPLCLDKSVFMIVAILAVLKAGGAYVPLDPNNPIERNNFILNETKTQVVITLAKYKQNFEKVNLILLDTDDERIRQNPATNPNKSQLERSNLCYVMFTSGSTGTPKGVMVEHSAVANFIQALDQEWKLTTNDSVLQFTNYTFDISVIELLHPLTIGACISISRQEYLLSDLEESIRMLNVTSILLTPTIATLIDPAKVPSVKRLMNVGEMLTTTARNIWYPYVEICNGYGPTETTVLTLINPEVKNTTSCGNIGKPIGNNRIYILDLGMNFVPIGAVGELYISGPQLARGYLNRPDLTQKVFVASPFVEGERMYNTGDLARFNEDGSVELMGRKDNQIKIHGLRVELDEIENAIHGHPQVASACVLPLVSDESINHQALVTFIVFKDLTEINDDISKLEGEVSVTAASYIIEVAHLLRKRLPSYMVPTIWVPINKMPTTTSEKINRKFLADFYTTIDKADLLLMNQSVGNGYVEARTTTEKHWVNLWSKILNMPVNSIGVNDSFFALGGDSILAIKLISVARRAGFELTVQDLYSYPTITEIASLDLSATSDVQASKSIEKYALLNLEQEELDHLLDCDIVQNGIDLADVDDIYPCSPLQEGLMAVSMKDNASYLTQRVFKFEPSVNVHRLQSAWEMMIRANPILRTTVLFSTSNFSHLSGLQGQGNTYQRASDSVDTFESS